MRWLRKSQVGNRSLGVRVVLALLTAFLFEALILSLFPSRVNLYKLGEFSFSVEHMEYKNTSFAIPASVFYNKNEDLPFAQPALSTSYIQRNTSNGIELAGPYFYLCTGTPNTFPESRSEIESCINKLMPSIKIRMLGEPIQDEVVKSWRKIVCSVKIEQYQAESGPITMIGNGYITFVEDKDGNIGMLLSCSADSYDKKISQSRERLTAEIVMSFRMEPSDGTFIEKQLTNVEFWLIIQNVGNIIGLCTILMLEDRYIFQQLLVKQSDRCIK